MRKKIYYRNMKYRTRMHASLLSSLDSPMEKTSEEGEQFVTSEIQVFPLGEFKSHHQQEEGFTITHEIIAQMIDNFYNGIGGASNGKLPVYVEHDGPARPAAGWVIDLIDRGIKGMWAIVKWNKYGLEQIRNELYQYISPEWAWEYEDSRTGKTYENVLFAPALVNDPYFNTMQYVSASQKSNQEIINVKLMMDLQAILTKKVEEITDEEKAFLREKSAELTDEQKAAFASVLEDVKVEEEKAEPVVEEVKADAVEVPAPVEAAPVVEEEKKEEPAEVVPPVVEPEVVTASDSKVKMMTAAEQTRLIARNKELEEENAKMVASERKAKLSASLKSAGHTPAMVESATEFASELTEDLQKKFEKVLASYVPAIHKTRQSVVGEKTFENAEQELDFKARELMAKDSKLALGTAMSQVLSSDKDLAKRKAEGK